ncbi:MFS transporter [Streptomyces uncialis]|uniref:MFS transporter n=1 Tax=Streptomyces uncialis TaxID=1048205 RepID=UPI003655625F
MTVPSPRRSPAKYRARVWPGVLTAALTATVTVMPGFAVGALAPGIGSELRMSRTGLGLSMTAFYAATALGSPLAKRTAARLPTHTTLATASLIAAAVMLGVSRAGDAATLTALLVVGGLGNALVQPAAGRLIVAGVPGHRRSLAAGTVGAALAAATLVPGLLVAFVVPGHGWRTAMTVAGLVAMIPAALAPLTVPRTGTSATPTVRPTASRSVGPVLALWALAAALSAAGNNAVATYFVQLGAEAGLSGTLTGNLLSLSALCAIAVRLAAGALTDRAPHHNPAVIAAMMASGGIGLVLISTGSPTAFLAGAVLAFSAGWGWTGLLLAAALRLVPDRAEHAGHTVQVGIYTGATVAPFAFAALTGAVGFAGASLAAATAAFAGAAATTAGAFLLRPPARSTPASAPGGTGPSAAPHSPARATGPTSGED